MVNGRARGYGAHGGVKVWGRDVVRESRLFFDSRTGLDWLSAVPG